MWKLRQAFGLIVLLLVIVAALPFMLIGVVYEHVSRAFTSGREQYRDFIDWL